MCWSTELGLFVAVATVGVNLVMTSPDGINWTSHACPVGTWRGVCWSPEVELFVAIATSGDNRVMASPDGVIWTVRGCPSGLWRDIWWAPGINLFVVVSRDADSLLMTSPDGINWTDQACPSGLWRCVCWSPELGLLVAVAGDYDTADTVMTSSNGITWTIRTASSQQWVSILWITELGIFAAISNNSSLPSYVMTSSDGINWDYREYNIRFVSAIWWPPELYMVAAASNEIIYTQSADIDLGSYLKIDGSWAMTGVLDMGANKITATYVPSGGTDLVNKTYVDGVASNYLTTSTAGDVSGKDGRHIDGALPATSFIKSGGLSTEFLLANGNSVATNTYAKYSEYFNTSTSWSGTNYTISLRKFTGGGWGSIVTIYIPKITMTTGGSASFRLLSSGTGIADELFQPSVNLFLPARIKKNNICEMGTIIIYADGSIGMTDINVTVTTNTNNVWPANTPNCGTQEATVLTYMI